MPSICTCLSQDEQNQQECIRSQSILLALAAKAMYGRASLQGTIVMNCPFNNPKSSRFFPRLHGEEEWEDSLDCMGIQEG